MTIQSPSQEVACDGPHCQHFVFVPAASDAVIEERIRSLGWVITPKIPANAHYCSEHCRKCAEER